MRLQSFPLAFTTLAILAAFSAALPQAQARDPDAASNADPARVKADFIPGKLLVKFKGTILVPNDRPSTPDAPSGRLALPNAAQSSLAIIDGKVDKVFAELGVVRVSTSQDTGRAIEALYRSGTVVYAEPDYRLKADRTPNDPKFPRLWGMHNTGQTGGTPDADIDAPEAWDERVVAPDVVLAVIDTGVDYRHKDLRANMWTNPQEIADNGIDDDNNGYVDDVYGIDTYNGDSDPIDDHGHGTHVSGTIAGRGNNQVGVAGVAWRSQIMALKFLGRGGTGPTSGAIEAINYALAAKQANGYQRVILSNSWGGGSFSQALYDAIDAARAAGVLFTASAGNDGSDTDTKPHYPSSYDLPNIVSVGATDHRDRPASFSNYGCGSVDLFAPGNRIYSTVPGNGYEAWSGTSMAVPHVSGAAAIIWSEFASQDWKAVKRALMNGADTKSSLAGLANTQARLNLRGGLTRKAVNRPSVWGLSTTSAAPGDRVTLFGSNFGSTKGKVSFGTTLLSVKKWTQERITATLPANTQIGTGRLRVQDARGHSNPNGQCFSVALAPQLVGKTIIPHGWAAGAKVGNHYWILGGGTSWGQTGLVERYTPAKNRSVIDSRWMMPTPLTSSGAAAIGKKIYVVGGLDWASNKVSNALQIFDTATGTWSKGAKLPIRLSQPAVVSLTNGKLYVFGGIDSAGTALSTTYIYHPGNDTWSTGARMPTARSFAAGIQQGTSNLAWIMGGYTTPFLGDELKTVEVYRANKDSWSSKPDLTQNRGAAAGTFYRNQPHLLHGSDLSGRKDGEWFEDSTWVNGIRGTQSLRTCTGATFDGVYVFGGYDDDAASYSDNVWRVLRH